MSASKNGHVEVVDMLLQHGARVDLQNEVCFDAQYSFSFMHTEDFQFLHAYIDTILSTGWLSRVLIFSLTMHCIASQRTSAFCLHLRMDIGKNRSV